MDKVTQGITNLPISATLELFIAGLVSGAAAYLWYRFKKIESKMETSMSREEVKEMIEDKVRHIEFMVNDINSDVKRMDYKLDKVLTALLQSKQGE